MIFKQLIILTSILFNYYIGFCQQNKLFENAVLSNSVLKNPNTYKNPQKKNNYLFTFYKKFISSQDGSGCTFLPSCSLYAARSIKENGIFLGILSAFDRVSRCNGHNRDFYILDYNNQKLIDDVE